MKKFLLHFTGLFLSLGICFSAVGSDNNKGAKPFQPYKLSPYVTSDDYQAGMMIFKLKPETRSMLNENGSTNSAVSAVLNELQVSKIERAFPFSPAPESKLNSWGVPQVDLTLIFKVHYSANVDIESAINKLLVTGQFQYVEPNYIYHINFTPNDPSYTNAGQYFIKKVKADSAWNVTKGDTNVVIGIADSGTDPNHPDLKANLKINWGEIPNNGIDDDGDGYVDNYLGYDLSDNRPDPTVGSTNIHGSYVSGDADAVTNNGVGVASPGFMCKFMAVRCAADGSTTAIDHGYEGIVYLADHGCNIINCSWGGNGGDQYGQDVMTYATINKNALVVCSAGNNNTEVIQYPAGYTYVLNVASTTSTDAKSSFSSYGTWVTICAPGSSIYSTAYSSGYASVSGTSMASPVTAGCAALVKSMFPSYNGLQIKEQLRATADNIYGLAANSSYQGKLGTGRVNVYRAVSSTSTRSIGMININTTDNNDDVFVIGDTLRITGDIVNYLSPATNLVVTMSTASSYVTILNNSVNVGPLGTMGTFSNSSNAFTAVINAGTPANSQVIFTFTFTDGSYSSTMDYSVIVNVDYLNVTVNDISTSVTSKSMVAYNDADLNTRAQGLGFMYRDTSMMFECGFMVGDGSTRVSDNVRQGGTAGLSDVDFVSNQVIKRVNGSTVADFESFGKFKDSGSPSPMGILVTHHTMAWSTTGDRKYVIIEYTIKNTGTTGLTNVYAGYYTDWDVGAGGALNKGNVDKTLKLGYVWKNVTSGLYGGIKLLTKDGFNHYAMDNGATDGSIAVYTSYTNAEKFTSLSTPRDSSGGAAGGDVSQVVSTGPLAINAGDSVVVAFALLAGDDLVDLKKSAVNAQIKYDGFTTGISALPEKKNVFSLSPAMPNPAKGVVTFRFSLDKSELTSLTVYDITGQKVKIVLNQKINSGVYDFTADLSGLSAGIYFYKLQSGDNQATGKLQLVK